MPISAEDIVGTYSERRKRAESRHTVMHQFDAVYSGETYLPLPELDRTEKPMVANLLQTGLDQTAMRVASTLPDPEFPPMRTTVETAERRARQRHEVILSWWHMNDMALKMKERARHLLGYSTSPVRVGYDPTRPHPVWHVLDPFSTFAPPPSPNREMTPYDAVCTYTQTLGYLRRIYPHHMAALRQGHEPKPDDLYTCLQYFSDTETALIVMGRAGPENDPYSPVGSGSGRPWMELERQPNRAGVCPVVVPNRIVLNRNKPMGAFDGLLGVFEWQAKLMALGAIAAEQDVFPDIWAVSRPNENVNIEVEADGLQGVVGRISGGAIDTTHKTPGGQTLQMISILERALRLEGGVPAEFTGESPSSTRTARRGAQVLSEAVDFAIQEAQQIFEVSLREENVRAIAVDKAYYGPQRRAFYFDWKGRKGSGEYDPLEIWETDRHSVNYSMPGSDANSQTVIVGQNIGMGLMSKERGMELTPSIKDPALEKTRVTVEALEQAFLAGIQTMVSQPGGLPLPDLARIIELVEREQMPLYRAVQKVQQEAQARQAADTAVAPDDPAAPVDPASAAAQPGIAAPGQGAEAGTIPETAPGLDNLDGLFQALRGTARGVG